MAFCPDSLKNCCKKLIIALAFLLAIVIVIVSNLLFNSGEYEVFPSTW